MANQSEGRSVDFPYLMDSTAYVCPHSLCTFIVSLVVYRYYFTELFLKSSLLATSLSDFYIFILWCKFSDLVDEFFMNSLLPSTAFITLCVIHHCYCR